MPCFNKLNSFNQDSLNNLIPTAVSNLVPETKTTALMPQLVGSSTILSNTNYNLNFPLPSALGVTNQQLTTTINFNI